MLSLTSSLVFSQTGVIRGKVTDKQSQIPIEGANIILIGIESVLLNGKTVSKKFPALQSVLSNR